MRQWQSATWHSPIFLALIELVRDYLIVLTRLGSVPISVWWKWYVLDPLHFLMISWCMGDLRTSIGVVTVSKLLVLMGRGFLKWLYINVGNLIIIPMFFVFFEDCLFKRLEWYVFYHNPLIPVRYSLIGMEVLMLGKLHLLNMDLATHKEFLGGNKFRFRSDWLVIFSWDFFGF